MTALGVCQQGKLLDAPPTGENYHKICSCDKENSTLNRDFTQKVIPTEALPRVSSPDVSRPDGWQPDRGAFDL